jgi:anti-sigma regulatory factor (Ser/Thr protein kinase)
MAHAWGLPHLADTAELLVSELVTNAVQASQRQEQAPGVPVIWLWLASDAASIAIHVWDGSEAMPERQVATTEQDSGRGLMLVEALSKEWGVHREAGGKVVWVVI